MICVDCNKNECADGWRVCGKCHSKRGRARIKARAAILNRECQVPGLPSERKTLADDENNGLYPKSLREYEDRR